MNKLLYCIATKPLQYCFPSHLSFLLKIVVDPCHDTASLLIWKQGFVRDMMRWGRMWGWNVISKSSKSVVERKWADFVIMGSSCSTPFCARVYFSKDFWDTTLPKLESFFNCWIIPELGYLCVKYVLPKLSASSFRVL